MSLHVHKNVMLRLNASSAIQPYDCLLDMPFYASLDTSEKCHLSPWPSLSVIGIF